MKNLGFFFFALWVVNEQAIAQAINGKVLRSSKFRIVSTLEDDHFIGKGDAVEISDIDGFNKCRAKVLKVKENKALLSTRTCDFLFEKGSQVSIDHSDKENNWRFPAAKDKDEMPLSLKNSFAISFGFMPSSEIDFDDIKASYKGETMEFGAEELKYKKGVFFALKYFDFDSDSTFCSFSYEIWTKSKDKEGGGSFIMPQFLIGNYGIIIPQNGKYFKAYVGGGGGSLMYKESSFSTMDSLGWVFQFGVGIMRENLFFDIVLRHISGALKVKSTAEETSGVTIKSDYSYTEPILKIGFLF